MCRAQASTSAAVAWLLAVMVLLTASPLAGADRGRQPIWPMYRGDPQRTGQSPFKGPAPMRVKWKVDLKREICASPAVAADGTLYVGAGAVFYAITPAGQVLWSCDFSDGGYSQAPKRGNATGDCQGFTSPSPALAPDGTIYQACGDARGPKGSGFLMALNSRPDVENRIHWAFKTNIEMRSSPVVVGGTCFVGSRMVLAVDGVGKRKWEGGQCEFSAVTSSPALSRDGTTVYVGGFDGRLHALDAKSGKTRWTAGAETPSSIRLPQRDAQGRQTTGFTTKGHIADSPAVGPDGTIYFGSWDGHLYAATLDGRLRWKMDLKDRVSSAPAVCPDGRVLVSTYEGTLYAVRTKGGRPMMEWQAEANCRYSSPLISSDGKVYVGGLDGKLRAYALASGKLLGELAFEGWIYASPVSGGDGILYVGASDGYLRAIEMGPAAAAPARADRAAERQRPAVPGTPPDRVVASPPSASANTLTHDEALKLAREYMDSEDAAKRAEILRTVDAYGERLDEIALALRPAPPKGARTGHLAEEKFTVPRLRARMERIIPRPEGPVLSYAPSKDSSLKAIAPGEEYMNWAYVPESYDPAKPLGLVVSLHGGAGSSLQSTAGEMLAGSAKLFGSGPFIVVCPGAPPLVYSWGSSKFCFPESEIHIQSVIEEYSARYAIDPNRVFLTGFSMGGIGSWWHAFRHGDRFAAVAPMAGTWRGAYWPSLRGTLLCMMNGAFDHHTHVDFTRHAHARLQALGIPNIDVEYLGPHSPGLAQPQKAAIAEVFKLTRRDPYCPHVCAISPFIPDSEASRGRYPPQTYRFWVSVSEIGADGVPVEFEGFSQTRGFEGATNGDRSYQRMMRAFRARLMKAGAVDAENLGGNRLRVQVANAKRFALWLHPKMGVDLAKPLEIELVHMGLDPQTTTEVERRREKFTAKAQPSLAAMLKYLGDRRDFGLIYHAAVEVEVRP